MTSRRLTGRDHSVPPAAVQSSRAAMRRSPHAHMASSIQAQLAREQNRPARHQGDCRTAGIGPRENDGAADRALVERPRFARLHASIAERQLDWGWQNSPDSAKSPRESELIEAKPAGTGFSARAVWLGGIAFALLAAGVISAVATVQSSRPLPFETWARGDLMQRPDGMPTPTSADAVAGALRVAPTAADGERGEIDAALAAEAARLESADVDIAGVGPILASASAAQQLAARLAAPALPDTALRTGTARPLPGPHGPVFRPLLVSSSRLEPAEATLPSWRRR